MAKARKKTGKKKAAPKVEATPEPEQPPTPEPSPEPAAVPEPTETEAPPAYQKAGGKSAGKTKSGHTIRGGLRPMWMVEYDDGTVITYESLRELAWDARQRGLNFKTETLHAFLGRLQRGVVPYAQSFVHYKGMKVLKRLGPGARSTELFVPYGTNLLAIKPRVRKPRPPKKPKTADGDVATAEAAAATVPDTVTPAAAACNVA